jgi:hypothetical protein
MQATPYIALQTAGFKSVKRLRQIKAKSMSQGSYKLRNHAGSKKRFLHGAKEFQGFGVSQGAKYGGASSKNGHFMMSRAGRHKSARRTKSNRHHNRKIAPMHVHDVDRYRRALPYYK